MKNEKQKNKSESEPVYSISVILQAGRTATFTYNSFELADAHFYQLQATQVVGSYGIKKLERSWKK